jgi:alpha-glucosidase
LLTRWTELATFQPIDRNHTNKGSGNKEVWVHGPEQEAIRRRYIEERYRLLPYLYTAVEELTRTGIPVDRPLFLEFPAATADKHPLDLDAGAEFMFGHAILVAPPPFFEQPDNYELKLPPGAWYDYWTGAKIQNAADDPNSKPVVIAPKLEVLPVYVREGAIVPMQPLVQSTEETPQGPLTLRVYPGKNCHGSLYADDGKTLAYQHGDFLRLEFSCDVTPQGLVLRIEPHGDFHPWWKEFHVEVYGWDGPAPSVVLNGTPSQLRAAVDPSRHLLTLDLAACTAAQALEFRKAQ